MRIWSLAPVAPVASLASLALVAVAASSCVNGVDDEFGQAMGAGNDAVDEQGLTGTCADGPTVRGVDVSYYQHDIDWKRAARGGVKFAIIRVSDGTGFIDPKFEANWREAKQAGIIRGVYQFFEADEDPVAQADVLLRHMGPLAKGDLPPMLDIEDGSNDGEPSHLIASRARAWVNRIESKLHVEPIVYTGYYEWVDAVGSADFNDLPLDIASYGVDCPYVPPTWRDWTLHQFTSTGRVAGIPTDVDVDRFNGTLQDLKDMTVGAGEPRACVTGHYHGDYCDDDNQPGEDNHDRLREDLGVPFSCGKVAGQPAFCGRKKATRAEAIYVITKAARIPLAGHPDAFRDDDKNRYERFLDAAHAYGILVGFDHGQDAKPGKDVTRNQLAHFLKRMYRLPAAHRDWFSDDNGGPDEDVHNAVAAAGLLTGYADGHGHKLFKGGDVADRTTLARVAVRAHDHHLRPVWRR